MASSSLFFSHPLPCPSPARYFSSAKKNLISSIRCSSASTQRQELFNRIAPVYDNLNDLLSLGQHRVWKRMAISWSGARKGDCVLDICCGSGDLTFLLSDKIGSQGKVTGLDFSSEQLSVAAHRQGLLEKPCYQNIVWVEGDALFLPFPDNYFDAITVGFGLRNIVDRRKAMSEMLRVLKPGSKASILDFNKSTQPLTTSVQVCSSSKSFYLSLSNLSMSLKPYATDVGKELEELSLEVGFSCAKHYEIGGGLMGNLVATR
ncbi:2-phytyl-1,4-beta-naphthoquinone methyltransferase, chloroplastic-like isoform X2 [Papaver somniferum]|uniref:2-phytyl-1,4-beta-naphthoquinone methyltransferase, chloroplastic-like isoform X2 n=1 Tax=Papaver somniferum TaxID=3469 RepID=UPI000E706060|nr:2-phytyl-1,4-beta-naphthoquinone methyltransferase, chloroplastic-like isoform X2 [Papaver somniferum]